MYRYIGRKNVPTSDRLSLSVLEDNDGLQETVSFFLERDKRGFLINVNGRSILVELDWRGCVCVKGPYPHEIALLPMVPAFCSGMRNCFPEQVSDEFKQIVQKVFSADFIEENS